MGKLDDLFAMKWVLPEHNQALSEHYFEQSLSEQPLLEQDELDEINRLIQESIHYGYELTVTWFRPVKGSLGRTEITTGNVEKVDTTHRQIKMVNEEGYWWILLGRIIGVRI